MEEIVYNSLSSYYNALNKLGYMSYPNAQKLLVLAFYNDFVFKDYRGLLSREDYFAIEKALDCLYGSTCLIPYPDYLKMGKLYIGETTELAHRVKTLEDTDVMKVIHNIDESEGTDNSDIIIEMEE